MKTLALFSQNAGATLPDTAATRFIEDGLSPLLIVRELNSERCVLADGQVFSFRESGASSFRRREISSMLFSNVVRVRGKELSLPRSINRSPEKRRLFGHWLPIKENFEGIYLARLRPDGILEDLCTQGTMAGSYVEGIGWEKGTDAS